MCLGPASGNRKTPASEVRHAHARMQRQPIMSESREQGGPVRSLSEGRNPCARQHDISRAMIFAWINNLQMTPRKPTKMDPAKLTPIGSLRPEFAVPLPAASLRDRFSPIKLLPVLIIPSSCRSCSLQPVLIVLHLSTATVPVPA